MHPAYRNTICVEDTEVLSHKRFEADQFVLRLAAPHCAARARPGTFVHIRCAADIPMRRPLSIMRVNKDGGWIEVLYKVMGHGLDRLSAAGPGDSINILGPIGNGFTPDERRPAAVMIGGGVGIPPLVFLAEHLHARDGDEPDAVAFFGSELPFPFELVDSAVALPGIPDAANRSLALLEKLGIASRLATTSGHAGCYAGYVTDLAGVWLETLTVARRAQITLYACGPEPMLAAVAALARRFDLPAQLCLEEFMACGVGGCAGCTVEIHTADGPAMKRVCVDGPVFAGATVYPD